MRPIISAVRRAAEDDEREHTELKQFSCKAGDTFRPMEARLEMDEQPIDLSRATVDLVYRRSGQPEVSREAEVGEARGEVSYQWQADETLPGRVAYCWVISWPDGRTLTIPSSGCLWAEFEPRLPDRF